MPTKTLLLAAATVGLAVASSASAVVIDSFAAVGGTVAYPQTDTIRGVYIPPFEPVPGVFGGLRATVISALFPDPVPPTIDPLLDDVATLDIDTAAGLLLASATPDIRVGVILAYGTDTDGVTPDVDVSGEDRVRIVYSSTSDLLLEATLSNSSATGRQTNGSRSPVLTLPAGEDVVFDVPFSALTETVRVPFGPSFVDLPAVDLTSLDGVVLNFRSTDVGASFALDDLALVPEPATLGLAGAAGLALLRRRRA